MTGQPRLDGLVQYDLGILMPGPAQGHDEDPRLEWDTGLVREHRAGAEINLGGFGGRELEDRRRLDDAFGRQTAQHPLHGVVTAGIAVIALKGCMDCGALDAGVEPLSNLLAVRFHRGDATAWHLSWNAAEDACDLGVFRHRLRRIEPASRLGFLP